VANSGSRVDELIGSGLLRPQAATGDDRHLVLELTHRVVVEELEASAALLEHATVERGENAHLAGAARGDRMVL